MDTALYRIALAFLLSLIVGVMKNGETLTNRESAAYLIGMALMFASAFFSATKK